MGTGAPFCGADMGLLGEQDSGGSLNWEPPSGLFLTISSTTKRLPWYPWRQKLKIIFSSSSILNVFFFLMSSHRKGIAPLRQMQSDAPTAISQELTSGVKRVNFQHAKLHENLMVTVPVK